MNRDIKRLDWGGYIGILGWVLSLLVPLMIYHQSQLHNVEWSVKFYLTFFGAVLILWMFRLVPYLLPALLLITFCLILDIVPENVILSGFTSKSFFLVLTFSFLGAIIIKSNLLLRVVLWLLARVPSRLSWLESILYFVGLSLSAIINVQTNRFDITVPIYRDLIRETGLASNAFARSCLSLALYAGSIYFSELFLTGKSTNFPVLEMLPEQTQLHFTWVNWLLAASVPIVIMQISLLSVFFFLFHKHIHFEIPKEMVKQNLAKLGRVTFAETIAVLAIIVLVIGIVLSSLHIVQLAWFGLVLLFFLLLFPILNKQEFRSYINWSFLLYLAAIIGIVQSMHYLHIDEMMLDTFPLIFSWAAKNIYCLIIVLFLVCMLSTFLIGTVASIILLLPLLLPLAGQLMISPWIIAFVVTVACEAWFLPYQSTYQLYFEELTDNDKNIAFDNILKMNLVFIPCRLIGLLLSVGYWRHLGLL